MNNHGDHEGPNVGCEPCGRDAPRLIPAAKQRAYRDRKRGGPPRELAPHGTRAAIRRHERAREPLCEPCRLERNRLARHYHQRRKP
jgi:hypothetical protein